MSLRGHLGKRNQDCADKWRNDELRCELKRSQSFFQHVLYRCELGNMLKVKDNVVLCLYQPFLSCLIDRIDVAFTLHFGEYYFVSFVVEISVQSQHWYVESLEQGQIEARESKSADLRVRKVRKVIANFSQKLFGLNFVELNVSKRCKKVMNRVELCSIYKTYLNMDVMAVRIVTLNGLSRISFMI
jgi:hypothetical protein